MSVSVVVPFRGDHGGPRDAAWAWVRARYAQMHPDWQVVPGGCPDGPWRKALAVRDALTRADGDTLIVADGDVWSDGLPDAVRAVQAGAPWAIPHGPVYRLSPDATAHVHAGWEPHRAAAGFGLARPVYCGIEGGGYVVLTRDAYTKAPLDPRFAGWGGEDEAWARSLTALVGARWRGTHRLWHLWHPPAERLNEHVGSAPSHALLVRYQYASADLAVMRHLIAEADT